MSIRMSQESYDRMNSFSRICFWSVVFWMVVGTWLCPACREVLPPDAQRGFNQLDSLVETVQ